MSSTSKIYTTVDDINRHVANVFALYPTLYANHDSLSLYLQVIAPLIKNSKEFCTAIHNKNIGIGSATGVGGFSVAGPLNVKLGTDRIPMASGVSFAPDGSWVPYFMETFSKTSHSTVPISIRSVSPKDNRPMGIISSDPVHEALVGALASHLFDIGVAPSFMKYLGFYTCDDTYDVHINGFAPVDNIIKAKPYFIFEKSDIEMYELLGGELQNHQKVPDVFSQLTPYDFMIWHTQLAHTQFVGKHYFGITHIDGHSKNIMLTHVKNTGNAIKWKDKTPTPLTYGKVELSKANNYEYIMPFKVDINGHPVEDTDNKGIEARIILENNGFLPKEIDFGLTIANLKESVVAKDQNIAFVNEPDTYDKPIMGYSAVMQDTKGDLDYNYSTLNIAYRIARAINFDEVGYKGQKDLYKSIWSTVLPFWRSTLPARFDPGNMEDGGPVVNAHTADGSSISGKIFGEFTTPPGSAGGYHMRARAVGTTNDIQAPLKNIWNYLLNLKLSDSSPRFMRSENGKIGYLSVSRNNTPIKPISKTPRVVVPYYANPRFSSLQKFIMYNFSLWRACIPRGKFLMQSEIDAIVKNVDPRLVGKNSIDVCSLIDEELAKYNPNNKKPYEFFKNLITRKLEIWDPVKHMLKPTITRKMLESSDLQRSKTANTQLFSLRFNPTVNKMSKIAVNENFVFSSDQRAINFNPPDNLGEPMKMVNVHLLYVNQSAGIGSFAITCEYGKDLYKSSRERLKYAKSGISVNGGYFIVEGNISDPLNYNLNQSYSGYPIGYFYSTITPEFNGTRLPVPRSYQENFATIYTTTNGALHMEKSIDFENRHETDTTTVMYDLTDRTPNTSWAVERKIIKLRTESNGISYPIMNASNTSFSYTTAFECGPILIWDGNIEFTRKKMEESLFQVNLQKDIPVKSGIQVRNMETYKVVTSAQNSRMYFNEPGERNFPYGQRHSNSLMIHNVLCETKDGEILFVFVEGRGFDAVGLDRAQLAELISRFNVKNAVSLDGGFSANAVLKRPNADQPGYYWLLNDPDKRSLSSTIHFAEI